MCTECANLVVFAEQWAVVSEMEAALIEEQARLGLSIPGATRPLFAHELAAETRFAEIDQVITDAEAEVEAEVTALQDLIGSAAMVAIFGKAAHITATQLASSIAAMQANQPRDVQQAIARTTDRLAVILAGVYQSASEVVTGEAIRQGAVPEGTKPHTIPPAAYRPVATGVALYPWQRMLGRLYSVHLNPAETMRDSIPRTEVEKTVDTTGPEGAVDAGRQAVHGAHGDGRDDTAKDLEPTMVWASEILDGVTCEKCKAIDGKEYETVEDAMDDYPHGFYRNCLGGARCRGTLVFQFNTP